MENRRKRWYDLFGLLPRNLGRLLLWFSLIPIAFIIVLLVYAWRADQYELDEVLAPLENCAAYDRNGQQNWTNHKFYWNPPAETLLHV